MKTALRIGVLMGGPSAEHDVSLNSGENAVRALREKGYTVIPLILSRTLQFSADGKPMPFPEGMKEYDAIFNALHGTFGEDGQIQTILDDLKIPYTGSGAEASALGMDKWKSRELFARSGLAVPQSQIIKKSVPLPDTSFPAVVKLPASGSSHGVFIVTSREELEEKSKELFQETDEIIVEQHLKGREFTCGVLEKDGKPVPLPVVEIRPAQTHAFFDYTAKYTDDNTIFVVPASIDTDLAKRIQDAARGAHETIGCRVYSRSDFIVVSDTPHILEINTLPGLTSHSLLPKSAAAAGIPFPDLIELILLSSLSRFPV